MKPLRLLASGMVTGAGLTASSTCAAIRGGIIPFAETRFMSKGGEWIIGCQVPLDPPWRGREKLIRLVGPAIRECLTGAHGVKTEKIPLLMCIAEKDRPGRLDGLDDQLLGEVQKELGFRFHSSSSVIASGRVGAARAIQLARKLLMEDGLPMCLVAGVDTLLIATTLATYEEKDRLLTNNNSNGFIPGEAGTAILIGPATAKLRPNLLIHGLGFAKEKATVESEEPLRGDGMVEAIHNAMNDCEKTMDDMDYRLTDLSGEQYGFREAALAEGRSAKKLKVRPFELWHPANSIGEVGAAIGPCVLGVALIASRKGYAPGQGVLCHFANDDGERAAVILRYSEGGRL